MRRVANADATRRAKQIARLSRSSRDSRTQGKGHNHDRNIPDDVSSTLSLHRTLDDSFFENIRARAICLKRQKLRKIKQCCYSQERDTFAYATWNFQWKQIKPQWKSWFPHFPGDAPLPANSVESGGKGNGISRSSLSFYLSYPPPNPASPPLWNIPPTPSCNLAPSKRASTFPSAALAVSL